MRSGLLPLNGGQILNAANGGAWVSLDDGETWRQMYHERMMVMDIHVDSRDNNLLYMTTHHGKTYVSYRGKDTTVDDWLECPGVNYYGHQHIFENPFDASRFYLTTVGGGTWSVPLPGERS
jgi:hypothetical protein